MHTPGDRGQHPVGTVTPLPLTTTHTPGITAIPVLQTFLKQHSKTQGQDGNSGGLGTPALNPSQGSAAHCITMPGPARKPLLEDYQ